MHHSFIWTRRRASTRASSPIPSCADRDPDHARFVAKCLLCGRAPQIRIISQIRHLAERSPSRTPPRSKSGTDLASFRNSTARTGLSGSKRKPRRGGLTRGPGPRVRIRLQRVTRASAVQSEVQFRLGDRREAQTAEGRREQERVAAFDENQQKGARRRPAEEAPLPEGRSSLYMVTRRISGTNLRIIRYAYEQDSPENLETPKWTLDP